MTYHSSFLFLPVKWILFCLYSSFRRKIKTQIWGLSSHPTYSISKKNIIISKYENKFVLCFSISFFFSDGGGWAVGRIQVECLWQALRHSNCWYIFMWRTQVKCSRGLQNESMFTLCIKSPFPHSMDMHMTEGKKENIQPISVTNSSIHCNSIRCIQSLHKPALS